MDNRCLGCVLRCHEGRCPHEERKTHACRLGAIDFAHHEGKAPSLPVVVMVPQERKVCVFATPFMFIMHPRFCQDDDVSVA